MLVNVPAWAVLTVLVVASAAVRGWAGARVPGPWITPDEVVYAELGRGLYEDARLAILGGPTPFYSLVHPLLVGLPLSLVDVDLGYRIAKVLQAVVMSLAAVPVYLWGRSLAGRGWALAAAALTLALPGLAYSGLLMTEASFVPALLLAAWAAASALARPTPRNQALLVGAVMLASATRLQALVLLPAIVTAVLVEGAIARRRPRELLRLWPAVAALTFLAIGWAAWKGVGGYAAATETSYGLGDAVRSVARHAAVLVLSTGVVPTCALVLVVVGALLYGEPSDDVRAFLAVAAGIVVWFVLQVGVFASRAEAGLLERNLLALAPLACLGLAVWLARGAPRMSFLAPAVGLVLAVLVLDVPLDVLSTDRAYPNSLSAIPIVEWVAAERRPLAVYGGAALLCAAFALLPRRLAGLLPLTVAGLFIACSLIVSRTVEAQAAAQQMRLVGPEPRWIDEAADGPAAYLYDGEPSWNAVWLQVFWNRQIERVLALGGSAVPGPLPQTGVLPAGDGRLGPEPPFAVASTVMTFRGTPLATTPQLRLLQAGLVLWRLDPPARLDTRSLGVLPNGDVVGRADVTVYDCGPGALEVTLVAKEPGVVVLFRDGEPVERIPFAAPEENWNGALSSGRPTPSGEPCAFGVETPGSVATTRLRFARAVNQRRAVSLARG
jgi:hypothetical protein